MKYTKTKYPNIYTYQTSKGNRYYIRRSFIFQGKKKEITKSGLTTLAQARAALTEIEQQINNQELGINTQITLDKYWHEFANKRMKTGRWSDGSYFLYNMIYTKHILPEFGQIKLKDLSRNDYEVFLSEKLQTHTRHTVHTINSTFMAILNDAVKNGNLPSNRLKGCYIGESAIPPQNKRITLEQFKLWMKKAEELMSKTFFSLTYLTIFGLRRGEVFGLRTMDISFNDKDRAVLHLQDSRSNQCLQGKGGLKTESSERYVVLDERGTELLRFLMNQNESTKKKLRMIRDRQKDYISTDEKGKLINPNRLNAEFNRVNEQVGFHVTPHMMRHFFTTQSIIAGVPISHLSQALGHTKAFMTDKYNHVQDEVAAQVTDSFISHIQ